MASSNSARDDAEQASKEGNAKFQKQYALAEQGNAAAQEFVGTCYLLGRHGIAKNLAKAAPWLQRAIDTLDVAKAQNLLGYRYYKGHGEQQDYKMAVQCYQKAAEQNLAEAQYNLGFCYYKGHGVLKDYKMAFQCFQKAAEQNHAKAQYNLGFCYYKGHGVLKDYKMAFQCFQKAAEQNHAEAQYSLGICYKNGHGVQQDYKMAAQCFQKAAEQNHAEAQLKLGFSLLEGKGCHQNLTSAHQWLCKAAENGAVSATEVAEQVAELQSKSCVSLSNTFSRECLVCFESFGPNLVPIMADNCNWYTLPLVDQNKNDWGHLYCISCVLSMLQRPNPQCYCGVTFENLGKFCTLKQDQEETHGSDA